MAAPITILKFTVDNFEHHVPKSLEGSFKAEVKNAGKRWQSLDSYAKLPEEHNESCDRPVIDNKIFHPTSGIKVETISGVQKSVAPAAPSQKSNSASVVNRTKRKITRSTSESKKDWKERLQELKLFEETKLEEIGNKINELEGVVNKIVDELQNTINFEKIESAKLNTKLGRDLSEDDLNMLLLAYDEDCPTVSELVDLPLAKKRTKATQLIKDLPGSDEYNLAKEQRVASIKNKVVNALKSGINKKVDETIKGRVRQNEEPVEDLSNQLAHHEFYQEELEKIEQAKLEKEIRDIRKKRARKRTAVNSAITQAAISAVVDDCILDTRRNIMTQYDNAVEVAKVANKQLLDAGKDTDKVKDDYQELAETVRLQLKKDKYNLPEIKVGSDTVRQKEASKRPSGSMNVARASMANQDLEVESQPVREEA